MFARRDLGAALAVRRAQLPMRLALGFTVAAGLVGQLGWLSAGWSAVWGASQLAEARVSAKLARHHHELGSPLHVAGCLALIAVSNGLFAGPGFLSLLHGTAWDHVSGTRIIAGVLMNAGPSTHDSDGAYIAALTPAALFAGALPVLALVSGASAADVAGLFAAVAAIVAAAVMLRRFALLGLETEKLANDAKGRFLAIMSHEIRTPVNGVLGMARARHVGETHIPDRVALR